jgi:SOS response regulatory protein OraA/RecX
MKSLVRRARLSREIATKLRAKSFSEAEIEATLSCLARNGLIDDDKTISQHVESKAGRRSVGAAKLRAELLSRGASEQQVEASFAAWDDKDELKAMFEALAGRSWNPNDRNRAGRFLASRGFDEELIETALGWQFGPELD